MLYVLLGAMLLLICNETSWLIWGHSFHLQAVGTFLFEMRAQIRCTIWVDAILFEKAKNEKVWKRSLKASKSFSKTVPKQGLKPCEEDLGAL